MTAPLLFSNNATTTLAGTLNTSATSVSVATGTGTLFPNPGSGQYFILSLSKAATGLSVRSHAF